MVLHRKETRKKATSMAAAASAFASSQSSSSKATPSPPPHSPLFSPIQEVEIEEYEDRGRKQCGFRETPKILKESSSPSKHHPTPVHPSSTNSNVKSHPRKRLESENSDADDRTVSCNKCRPGAREKISVVPLDVNGHSSSSSLASPNGIFKSILFTLTRKSPKSMDSSSKVEEQWKLAIAEISHKLIQVTRKRDEALLESSRLKYSMAELEKKLNKLEIYCHDLKSGLEVCSSNSPFRLSKDLDIVRMNPKGFNNHDKIVEHFLVSVSEARSSVRILSRSLTLQLRQIDGKVFERISSLLHPYDVKISFSKNPRSVLFYLEALLNRALYEDFESIGFQKSGSDGILNPTERCEANFSSFTLLQGLTWDGVLNRGTKHFSDEFSRFCDRKMSEIVAMLGWNRAWPEPLLQAFFGAAKNVWLVHLLAYSVHPGLPLFRVDKGMAFDGVYMEDMGGDKSRKLAPTVVRIMVAPGFYVSSHLVKCKVLCRYNNNLGGSNSSP